MARSRTRPGLHCASGIAIKPVNSGWKQTNVLVYSRVFEFEIKQDEDGWLVGSVPELAGCHTQARTKEELIERLHEAVEAALLDSGDRLSVRLFSTSPEK